MCASNSLSPPGTVDVYDSLPGSHSSLLNRQRAVIMQQPSSFFQVRYVNVQLQNGVSDCDLFAIAFAVDLCERKDPHMCLYEQSQMRAHLHILTKVVSLNSYL